MLGYGINVNFGMKQYLLLATWSTVLHIRHLTSKPQKKFGQGTSEKVEFIIKSATPNVDISSSSTNQSSIDDHYIDCNDSTTSHIHQQENDYCIA
ncbi:PREDICTED: uncharacterized protein LOC109339765 isoform X2 [Lupinus angustifolius]|uniref:uncharacterized protein LOC109339765 isoform X2 n=1 Tax=Lupinus angustifolius TaxID=3871 RepID=UPI00092F58CB|nr:PREDICTED: uncharacterized protein LOC109339765 isoform X2 [Lupinus angustifolius]